MEIKLGMKVRDRVTQLEGIVIGRTRWLTQCDTLVCQPQGTDRDGAKKANFIVDVTTAEVVDETIIQPEAEKIAERVAPKKSATVSGPAPG